MAGDRRDRPPLRGWLAGAGEAVYRAAVARRNRRFDAGEGVRGFAAPVVSVGNLSVGGTGKTPMVATIARWMLDAGGRPAIVMRGYGKRRGAMSDEEAEYRERFGERVVVAVNADRASAIEELLARGVCDRVILDDGFQHRWVRRDVDVVLIDATRDPFADRLLPAGWLREPVESLGRARAVVVTHADRVDDAAARTLQRRLAVMAPGAAVSLARHRWSGVRVQGLGGAADRVEPVAWLTGKRVVVAAAIGHPAAFIEQARAAGADVVSTAVRRDHHRWGAGETAALEDEAARLGAGVMTTLKDWVKFAAHARAGTAWVTPELDLCVFAGERGLRELVVGG